MFCTGCHSSCTCSITSHWAWAVQSSCFVILSYMSVNLGNNVNLVHFQLDAGRARLLSSAIVNCHVVHVPGHRIQILISSVYCDLCDPVMIVLGLISTVSLCSLKGSAFIIAFNHSFTVLTNLLMAGTCSSLSVMLKLISVPSSAHLIFSNCPSPSIFLHWNPLHCIFVWPGCFFVFH